MFMLQDEHPALTNATLQLYKSNIVKYWTKAYLCMWTETTKQRLTYFEPLITKKGSQHAHSSIHSRAQKMSKKEKPMMIL